MGYDQPQTVLAPRDCEVSSSRNLAGTTIVKLATLKDGTRDGRLLVVSDGSAARRSGRLAWRNPGGSARALERERSRHAVAVRGAQLRPRPRGVRPRPRLRLAAPLPRAPQWLDASAFPQPRRSDGQGLRYAPRSKASAKLPLMYQGASDDFLGPRDDMPLPSEADGIDFEAEVGVDRRLRPHGHRGRAGAGACEASGAAQ